MLSRCRCAVAQVTATVRASYRAPSGTRVHLTFNTGKLHAFDTTTGQTLIN
jgi:hypothetical protein